MDIQNVNKPGHLFATNKFLLELRKKKKIKKLVSKDTAVKLNQVTHTSFKSSLNQEWIAMDVINYLEKQKCLRNIDGSKYFHIHEHKS